MKTLTTAHLIALLSLSVAAQFVSADRLSYSYLGLDIGLYSYQETIPRFSIDTDYSVSNVGIQTGGYISVNETLGFYLTSSNTLGNSTDTEEWSSNGAILQTNSMQVSSSSNQLVLAYQTRPKQAIIGGVGLFKFDFDRFDFEVTPAGQSLGVVNPNGSQGREDFDLADSISETQLSVSALVGYEFGNLFLDEELAEGDSRFRYQAQFIVGLPVYISATNSSLQNRRSLNDSFGGVDAIVRLTAGWQVSEHVLLATVLETNYHSRDDIEDGVNTLPELDILSVRPALTMYWSF